MGEEEVARSFPVGGVREGVEEGCRAWKLRLIGRLPGGGIRREVGVSNAFRWKSRGG